MLHLPAQDVLEIRTAAGVRLVPFVAALVPEVDLDAGTADRLADVAGLLADEDERVMRIDVVTIFPEYLAPLRLSLVGRAIETGLVELGVHDLRRLDPRPAPDRRRHARTAAAPAW